MTNHVTVRRVHRRAADLKARFDPSPTYDAQDPNHTPDPEDNDSVVVPPINDPKTSPTPTPPTTSPTVAHPPTTTPVVPPPAAPTTSNTPPPAAAPTQTTPPANNPVAPTTAAGNTAVNTPIAGGTTLGSVTNTLLTRPATVTQSVTNTISSSTPSATETEAASSSNMGGIIGGVGGGVVGIALLIAVVAFLLRRARRKEDGGDFDDADPYGRSAIMLPDPPTHQDTVNAGFNPAPQMSQRGGPGAFAPPGGYSDYGAPHGGYSAHPSQQEQYHQDQYNQDQYNQGYNQPQYDDQSQYGNAPPTAHSANPFFANGAEDYQQQPPYSPITAPVPAAVAVSTAPQVLTRSPSMQSGYNVNTNDNRYSAAVPLPNPYASFDGKNVPTGEYLDMSRSSVTPFQAAQYADISKSLNTDVPAGLSTPAVEEYLRQPEITPPSPVAQTGSVPPMLAPVHDVSPMTPGFPSGVQTHLAGSGTHGNASQFPATPSPMASSFGSPTPPAQKDQFAKRESVYDPTDAYGGM